MNFITNYRYSLIHNILKLKKPLDDDFVKPKKTLPAPSRPVHHTVDWARDCFGEIIPPSQYVRRDTWGDTIHDTPPPPTPPRVESPPSLDSILRDESQAGPSFTAQSGKLQLTNDAFSRNCVSLY